jgi:hypothetical protein
VIEGKPFMEARTLDLSAVLVLLILEMLLCIMVDTVVIWSLTRPKV